MLDRVMAVIAFSTFAIFLGIIFFRVARVDLGTVIVIGLALVAYDLWSQLFPRRAR